MHRPQPVTLAERPDFDVIGEIIEPAAACSIWAAAKANCWRGWRRTSACWRAAWRSRPAQVRRAIARGVSVYQGDIDEGLADYPGQGVRLRDSQPDAAGDARRRCRCCRRCCAWGGGRLCRFRISATGRVRVAMLINGQAPKTKLFPYNWYNSPNIHFLSINDFEDLCREHQFPIERRYFLAGARHVTSFPNLMARRRCFCWAEVQPFSRVPYSGPSASSSSVAMRPDLSSTICSCRSAARSLSAR